MRTTLPVVAALSLIAGSLSAQAVVFYDDFSAGNAQGWTLGSEWQIGPATASTGQVYNNADPGIDGDGIAGGSVMGVVIGGNASTALHPFAYAESPAVNTSGFGVVLLNFKRWLNSDYTPYMQNTVEVFDGTTWQTVFLTGGSPGIGDNAWQNISYDVSAFANANFKVRFGFLIGSAGVFTVSSWNVDNVQILGQNCNSQPNSPTASLVINGPQPAGCAPFLASVPLNGSISFAWTGPPTAPVALVTGAANPSNAAIPCIGIVDIGTPPFYSDIVIVADGTQAGFINSLFTLDNAGNATQTFSVPPAIHGTLVNFQGIVFQLVGPCTLKLTAATYVTL